MSGHQSWAELSAKIMANPESVKGYEAARLRYELGKTVRERREELGLSQAELGKSAGLKQPAVARFEAGGTMPTIPVLERLAAALGMKLWIELRADTRSGHVDPAGQVGEALAAAAPAEGDDLGGNGDGRFLRSPGAKVEADRGGQPG
jgi:HTH-type transcriptional regulator/antitoxin HipB